MNHFMWEKEIDIVVLIEEINILKVLLMKWEVAIMKYAKIRKLDVTNGPGVRTTLFVSGCTHNCEGCFNKEQQDFNYGNDFTKETEDEFIELTKSRQIKGVNILGGEPMQQIMDDTLLNLLRRIKSETNKPIWLWSGYKFEEIIANPKRLELLKEVEVLIDGKFEIDKRDIMLKYRGSANQRVIDVKKSLEKGKTVEIL